MSSWERKRSSEPSANTFRNLCVAGNYQINLDHFCYIRTFGGIAMPFNPFGAKGDDRTAMGEVGSQGAGEHGAGAGWGRGRAQGGARVRRKKKGGDAPSPHAPVRTVERLEMFQCFGEGHLTLGLRCWGTEEPSLSAHNGETPEIFTLPHSRGNGCTQPGEGGQLSMRAPWRVRKRIR